MSSLRGLAVMTLASAALSFFVSVSPCPAQTAALAPPNAVAPLTLDQDLALLDPDMRNVIDLYREIAGRPAVDLTPQDARQQFSAEDAAKIIARMSGAQLQPQPIGRIYDQLQIDGPDGNKIPIRIYTPPGDGVFPVVLYFHGGGFVIATNDTYDASPRALAGFANAVVVSVEYRKAPEYPYPAALRDAIASYQWTLNNIGQYSGNPQKVAVAGESAGGNLATEVAIAARDQGLQMPTAQVLIYPVTSSNINQPSDILYQNALPLNTPLLKYFFRFYTTPSEANDPGVAPINADLRNLPPATIIAAEVDPLMSDGQAYFNKLRAAGNPAVYQLYTGTTHEFFGMGAVVAKAKAAEKFAASRLDASFR